MRKLQVKPFLITGDMIEHAASPHDLQKKKKLLELIRNFSKSSGYQINIQKSVVFLHINNKQM